MNSLAVDTWHNHPNECNLHCISRGSSPWRRPENLQSFWSRRMRGGLPYAFRLFPRLSPMEKTRRKLWRWQRTLYGWFWRIVWLGANHFRMVSPHVFAKSSLRSLRERAAAGGPGKRCYPGPRARRICNFPHIGQPLPANPHDRSRAKSHHSPSRQQRSQKRNFAGHHCPSRSYSCRVFGASVIIGSRRHEGVLD
jgi:hypothetical protein